MHDAGHMGLHVKDFKISIVTDYWFEWYEQIEMEWVFVIVLQDCMVAGKVTLKDKGETQLYQDKNRTHVVVYIAVSLTLASWFTYLWYCI